MAIITITEVQAITQITYSGSTQPTSTQITAWMAEAETWLEEWTGTKFTETTVTGEKHDGDGSPCVLLNRFPITSVTTLVVDGATLTENTDFWITDALGGMLTLKIPALEYIEGSTEGHGNIVATYKHGQTSVPQNIKEFCATIVALRAIGSATLAANPAGTIKSYSDGDLSITYADSDLNTAQLLKRYEELKLLSPRKTMMEVGSR